MKKEEKDRKEGKERRNSRRGGRRRSGATKVVKLSFSSSSSSSSLYHRLSLLSPSLWNEKEVIVLLLLPPSPLLFLPSFSLLLHAPLAASLSLSQTHFRGIYILPSTMYTLLLQCRVIVAEGKKTGKSGRRRRRGVCCCLCRLILESWSLAVSASVSSFGAALAGSAFMHIVCSTTYILRTHIVQAQLPALLNPNLFSAERAF